MKKILLGLSLVAFCSLSSIAGVIKIHYKGGTVCWLPGNACEGTIIITWLTESPAYYGLDMEEVPKGYKLALLKTNNLDNETQKLQERRFESNETSDGSRILVPTQTAVYSKKHDGLIVYVKQY